MQLMTGVHPGIYWLADFVCDAVSMLLMTVFIGVLFFFDPFHTFARIEVVGKLIKLQSNLLPSLAEYYSNFSFIISCN